MFSRMTGSNSACIRARCRMRVTDIAHTLAKGAPGCPVGLPGLPLHAHESIS